MPKKITKEEFIERAKKIHGDKYSYDKVDFINMTTKVCITCPIHGDFWMKPSNHVSLKQGCKFCSHQSYPSTKETFTTRANQIHNGKYTYDKVIYKSNKTKVWVTCPIHGDFKVRPDNHLHGSGCPKCGKISMAKKQSFSKKQFVQLAKEIHGDKYDYSKTVYKKSTEKVCIICPKHGEFWQTPDNHLHGHGCPHCNESKLEKEILNLLTNNKIPYVREKTFPWLKYRGNMFLDFYLPEHNIAIECQGIQHYELVDFFGGEKEFKDRIARDNVKKALCEKNGIKILYFSTIIKENILNNTNQLLTIIKNDTNNSRYTRKDVLESSNREVP